MINRDQLISTLRQAARYLRHREINQAIGLLENAFSGPFHDIQVTGPVDYHLAVVFEYLGRTATAERTRNLFNLLSKQTLLNKDTPQESFEYTLKSYFKALDRLSSLSSAERDVDNIIALRRQQFGSDDRLSAQLEHLKQLANKDIMPLFMQMKQSEASKKAFTLFLERLERLLEDGLASEIDRSDIVEFGAYIEEGLLNSEPELSERVLACIKKASSTHLLVEVYKRILCFESSKRKRANLDLRPILFDIITADLQAKKPKLPISIYRQSYELLEDQMPPHCQFLLLPLLMRDQIEKRDTKRVIGGSIDITTYLWQVSFKKLVAISNLLGEVPKDPWIGMKANNPWTNAETLTSSDFCFDLLSLAELGLSKMPINLRCARLLESTKENLHLLAVY